MNLEKLVPINSLEESLALAQAGKMPMREFLAILRASELYMPNQNDEVDGGVMPIFFNRDGVAMAAVFTDASRSFQHRGIIKSIIRMKGAELLSRVPEGYGVVLNPGFDTGLEIMPDGLKNVLQA